MAEGSMAPIARTHWRIKLLDQPRQQLLHRSSANGLCVDVRADH